MVFSVSGRSLTINAFPEIVAEGTCDGEPGEILRDTNPTYHKAITRSFFVLCSLEVWDRVIGEAAGSNSSDSRSI